MERLTYKDDKLNDYLPIEQVRTWSEFADRFYKFCDRLGELEDMIEKGELVEKHSQEKDIRLVTGVEDGWIKVEEQTLQEYLEAKKRLER